MASVPLTLQRLWADRDSGRLEALCRQQRVDLLLVFGPSLREPADAPAVDVAFSAAEGCDPAAVRGEFRGRYGDGLRVHDLDGMDAPSRRLVIAGAAVLVGDARGKFAEMLAPGA